MTLLSWMRTILSYHSESVQCWFAPWAWMPPLYMGSIKIPEKKLRYLIQSTTANGLKHASGPVLSSARYINDLLNLNSKNLFPIWARVENGGAND